MMLFYNDNFNLYNFNFNYGNTYVYKSWSLKSKNILSSYEINTAKCIVICILCVYVYIIYIILYIRSLQQHKDNNK